MRLWNTGLWMCRPRANPTSVIVGQVLRGLPVTSTAFTAVADLVPVPGPFAPPLERAPADGAYLAGQIGFFVHRGILRLTDRQSTCTPGSRFQLRNRGPGVPFGQFADLLRDAGASGQGASPPVWWFHIKGWQHRPEAPASRPSGATENLESKARSRRSGSKSSQRNTDLKALSGSVDQRIDQTGH